MVTDDPDAPKTSALPMDRIAAAVIDSSIILPPLIFLTVAPIKRAALIAIVESDQIAFVIMTFLIVVVGLVWIVGYQWVCLRFWQATLGQRLLKLKVVDIWGAPLSSSSCTLRSFGWLLCLLLLGLPFLGALIEARRRTLLDRLSDTMVISLVVSLAVAPRAGEKLFVRSIIAALTAFIALGLVIFWRELPLLVEHADNLDPDICEEVSDAMNETDEPQSRLEMALALYGGSLIDSTCLKQEAYHAIYIRKYQKALAYVSLALAHDEDHQLTEAYLQQVCSNTREKEPCWLSRGLRMGMQSAKANEVFRKLAASPRPYANIWAVRYELNQQNHQQALEILHRMKKSKAFAGFFIKANVQALMRLEQTDKAELLATVGLETLPLDQAVDIASFMCSEQLRATEHSVQGEICQWLADKDPKLFHEVSKRSIDDDAFSTREKILREPASAKSEEQ